MQEEWRRGHDNLAAVRVGLAGTGRVITSAVCIMVVVFAGFALHSDPVIKMFGLGMAVAIAVDATVVRGLLVPATMALLGRPTGGIRASRTGCLYAVIACLLPHRDRYRYGVARSIRMIS